MTRSARLVLTLLLTVLAGLAAWRILTLSFAENAATRPLHPEALLRQAEQQLAAGRPARAAATARALLAREPLEGRAYRVLAEVAVQDGRPGEALALYRIAALRAPRDLATRAWLTQHYLAGGDYDAAMTQVDQLLRLSPSRGTNVLPLLAKLAADPAFANALAGTLRQQPPWRRALLAALRREGNDVASREVHAALRRNGGHDDEEFAQWLDTLLQQGHWGEAYARWVGTLAAPGSIPAIFNGHFGHAPTGTGFDWRMRRVPGVLLEFVPGTGDSSLVAHARFRGRPVAAVGIEHPLLLAPGDYLLSVRMRAEGVRSERGLEWTMTCAGQGQPLAISERADGSFAWRTVSTPFHVPATGCPGLWLRLRNPAPSGSAQQISGELWFDDVTVTAAVPQPGTETNSVTPAAPAEVISRAIVRAKEAPSS